MPCMTWIGMKNCSRLLYIVVTTMHFKDRNWISKTMYCSCGTIDRRKVFKLFSSWDHCQRSSTLQISDTLRAEFEPVQNLSSVFFEWSCAVVKSLLSVCLVITPSIPPPLHHQFTIFLMDGSLVFSNFLHDSQ